VVCDAMPRILPSDLAWKTPMPLKKPIQPSDKCGKHINHMIQHYGNSILRLAGVHDIPAWTPLQAELVHRSQGFRNFARPARPLCVVGGGSA
jgi:hypothetical protein